MEKSTREEIRAGSERQLERAVAAARRRDAAESAWSDSRAKPESAELPYVGVVIIGRNEGERLRTCILSVMRDVATVVYVDSGSSDGSVELARSLGASVVELDTSIGFTAARARNAGARRLLAEHPEVLFIQFVDGDCEVMRGWMRAAWQALVADPGLAVVCGRRRERHPDASVYNRIVDMEWDTPMGTAREFGGDAMMRVSAYSQAGGYRDSQIAGEEPEFAVRLRRAGWQIQRIGYEMTLHDIVMTRFGQWWKRSVRAGHALAERAHLNGRTPERDCVRERRSTLFWGAAVPLAILAATLMWWPAVALSLVYPLQVARVARQRRRRGEPRRAAWAYAYFCILGKFANLVGLLVFHRNRLLGRASRIIEYRGEPATESPSLSTSGNLAVASHPAQPRHQ